jgi:hypothetical protein
MKKKSLLLTLMLMFICTGASISLIPDTVQAAITDHLAAIEIWVEYDNGKPNLTGDEDYNIGLCFDADATMVKISFLTPAGNSYEFEAGIVEEGRGDGWFYSGREPDSENTMGYEWCYEREFNDSASLDDFGDGTYTVTMHYGDGSTEQTTACFGVPGTCNPIVQPTEVPVITSIPSDGEVSSPVTFKWHPCSGPPLTDTWFEISDMDYNELVEEGYDGCTVDSYGPINLDNGLYEVDLGFESWYESTNSDGINIGAGKGIETDYYITVGDVLEDSDCDGIADSEDNCPDTWNSEQLDADGDGIGDVCDLETPGCGGCGEPACEKSLTDMIEELLTHYYWNILVRAPDSGGLDFWTDEIMTLNCLGGDIKEGFISFAQFFFNSQEYIDRNRTDEEYVTDLYHTFFIREPDSGGFDYWTGQLAMGVSRSAVLDHFAYSTEFNDFMNEIFD